jgi:hypothetical protein
VWIDQHPADFVTMMIVEELYLHCSIMLSLSNQVVCFYVTLNAKCC